MAALQVLVRRQRGGEGFDGKRVSDWAPTDAHRFKVPQAGNDDRVVALVTVWAEALGEQVDGRWWRNQLELARQEQARSRRHAAGTHTSPDAGPRWETVETVGAMLLEVHTSVLPDHDPRSGPATGADLTELTPYLPRAHDVELRHALAPALAGGPSVLAMLTGDSSTGKTRALYEAIAELAPDNPLLRPYTARSLSELVTSGGIEPGAIIWLNEAQRFLDRQDGELAAAQLHRLLQQRAGIVAVGTLWEEPYWRQLTQQGQSDSPHSYAAALLTSASTRRIRVPARLSAADQNRWRELAEQRGDSRLRFALRAGEKSGRVVQHLSGGPELLAAYLRGPGEDFTHVEHAVITAALDARRLGHRSPIPAALLAQAADGALEPWDRPADPAWCDQTLVALSTGKRPDDSRTDIRNTLAPLTALRTRSGAPAAYEPADYLYQHVPKHRADQLGTPSLWQALLEHTTDREDLIDFEANHDTTIGLGDAAWRRGLYKHAIRLLRKAVLLGHPAAAAELVERLTRSALDPERRCAHWAAAHTALSGPIGVAALIRALQKADADAAIEVLLDRDLVALTDLGDPSSVAYLSRTLREAGATDAAHALSRRAAAHADVAYPWGAAALVEELSKAGLHETARELGRRAAGSADVASNGVGPLLKALREAGVPDALRTLGRRAADHTDPSDEFGRLGLLGELRAAGLDEAVQTLLHHAAAHTRLSNPFALSRTLHALHEARADEAMSVLLGRDPAAHVRLDDAGYVSAALKDFRKVGAHEAVSALLNRDPAAHVRLSHPFTVVALLKTLKEIGADDALAALRHRAITLADLTKPYQVAEFLQTLREADADEEVRMLLDRNPAAHVNLASPQGVAALLKALREAGAAEEVRILLNRDLAAHVDPTHLFDFDTLLEELRQAGATGTVRALLRRAAEEVEPTNDGTVSSVMRLLKNEGADEEAQTLGRRAAVHCDLTDPHAVSTLLSTLHNENADRAVKILLERNPAAHVALSRTASIASLLQGLGKAGAQEAVRVLLARDLATHVDVSDPSSLAWLLRALRSAGADKVVQALLDRDPAADVRLTIHHGISDLLNELRAAGADDAWETLSRRGADAGVFIPSEMRPYGREVDGTAASPWTWNDLPPQP
ncbi:MAG: hypothetical protein HOV83_28460 [Catenulispora sp.]|nr:hypothetical protein [Catenulispora sp.]